MDRDRRRGVIGGGLYFFYFCATQINKLFFRSIMISRQSNEIRMGQKSKVIWLTGLPCSGKTTLAYALENELFKLGFTVYVLDGDNLRKRLNSDLGFSVQDRHENIRRIAEISSLFVQAGLITINAFVTPTHELRKLAQSIIGEEDYLEVFIDTPVDVCEQRDVKGMYKKARSGIIKDFTGVNAPFEVPVNPYVTVSTDHISIDQSLQQLLKPMLPLITL